MPILIPLAPLGEQRDFEQTDRADPENLPLPGGVIEDTALLSRQPFGIGKPADHDMRIKEKSGLHGGKSSTLPEEFPKI